MKPKKILCILSKYNYRDKKRGKSAEYNMIHTSLKKIFKKNVYFINTSDKKFKTIFDLNNFILRKVNLIKPNIVFFAVNTYEVFLETIYEIKKKNKCKIINWFSDDSWRYEQHSKYFAKISDLAITNHYISHLKNKKQDIRSVLTSWGCPDNWISETKKADECKYDVSFVGNNYFDRENHINFLKQNGIKVKCFGNKWNNSQSVSEEELRFIFRNSKISLNFSKSRGKIKQTKARIFEITGSGGFCITENSKELRNYFKRNEVISFSNKFELLKKINFFLENQKKRNEFAIRGNLKTKKFFKNSYLIKNIIKEVNIENFQNKSNFFKRKTYLYSNSNFLKLILKIIIMPFKKNKKIVKILRRIFFEIEWRLRGELTYTKNGFCSYLFNFD
tara:strand:+ start:98 stop:1267 length:1170 start_codon:yes stop_codon:yes gene_type:complete